MSTRDLRTEIDRLVVERFVGPVTELLAGLSAASSQEFLRRWLASEYFVSRDFPRWIAGLMFQVPRAEHRHVLAENIWDEHGHGDFNASHFAQCRAMVQSLGVTIPGEPPPAAAKYIEAMDAMIRAGLLPALAAVGPGNEYLIPHEYGTIWRHFSSVGWTSEAMATFFRSNIEADEVHIDQLEGIVRAELHEPERERHFFAAASRGIEIRLDFYRQLAASLDVEPAA